MLLCIPFFTLFIVQVVRSFCFCLMSSDAKSMLGTIYVYVYRRNAPFPETGVEEKGEGYTDSSKVNEG